MKRATEAVASGDWPSDDSLDTVTLEFDERHRRRVRLTTDAGDDFLLDMPDAVALADGDGLRLEDGGWIAVVAAPALPTVIFGVMGRHDCRAQFLRAPTSGVHPCPIPSQVCRSQR